MSQVSVFLPDGSSRSVPSPATVFDVAKSIGSGLAKSALAGKINGEEVDLSAPVTDGDKIEIITDRSSAGLEIIRHSTAHLMAMAIQSLWPGTQITIGPVIENGFYYDIKPPEGVKISSNDFAAIEKKMTEIAAKDLPVNRKVVSRDEAVSHFQSLGEVFKCEIVSSIPAHEDVKLYGMGEWSDLCRGPHVPSTGKLGHFKLMSVSGAFWRADSNNDQLTRIYGTAFATKKDLEDYLKMLEEAKKRDHIALGKQLELFAVLGNLAPGAAFFMPHGTKLYTLLQGYVRQKWGKYGFQEIMTPQVFNVDLWKRSGHYENYREDMYLFKDGEIELGIKPMSCPAHVSLFNVGQKSYRDLPLRYAEFGTCHRNELSGTLHGLTRLRRFTQDDGHIFCTVDQLSSELLGVISMVKEMYTELGIEDLHFALSTRPEKRLGADEVWDVAEKALEGALKAVDAKYSINVGDGAFYGPKIDIRMRDAIGRMHQTATIQLDFMQPSRLGAQYQTSHNTQEVPVMIHRAVLGSVDRFMGVYIEHTAGHFPVGLSPVQARILNVTEDQEPYARELMAWFKARGIRVEGDFSSDKLGAKIREAQMKKIPYMLVIGEKEAAQRTITPRFHDGKNLDPHTPEDFLALLKRESGPFWGLDINQNH